MDVSSAAKPSWSPQQSSTPKSFSGFKRQRDTSDDIQQNGSEGKMSELLKKLRRGLYSCLLRGATFGLQIISQGAGDDSEERKSKLLNELVNVDATLDEDYYVKLIQSTIDKFDVRGLDSNRVSSFAQASHNNGAAARRNSYNKLLRGATFKAMTVFEVIDLVSTELVDGTRCVPSTGFSGTFTDRLAFEGSTAYLKVPPLAKRILECGHTKSHLIGGASGSGKTMTLVGLGIKNLHGDGPDKKSITLPVLFNAQELFNAILDELKVNLDKLDSQKRDDAVLKTLVNKTSYLLNAGKEKLPRCPDVLAALRAHTEGAEITLVLGVDEAGLCQSLVRAMASLSGSTVKTELGLGRSVRVLLVACGTGVGSAGVSWGSHPDNFQQHFVDETIDEFKKVNEELFRQIVTPDCPFVVDGIMDVVCSNARMAAICGHLLRVLKTEAKMPKKSTKITIFDVRSILPIAVYRFKNLNGLQGLSEENAAYQMTLALRLHLFPCVGHLTDAEYSFLLAKYGLLVDHGRLLLKSTFTEDSGIMDGTSLPLRLAEGGTMVLCAPASGRYAMPLFTAMMLASISNMPLLARSAIAGDSLERHWLCVSALAASAAGTPALFTALLDSGRIAPLSRHVATEDDCNALNTLLDVPAESPNLSAGNEALADKTKKESSKPLTSDTSEESAESSKKKKGLTWLPALPSSANQSFFVCDLQLEKADQQVGTASEGADSNPIGNSALSKYVAAVTAGLKRMKEAGQEVTHIAAFRSPPRLPFADTVLFFNDTLYLFQAKDRGGNDCRWIGSTLREELVKMGADENNKDDDGAVVVVTTTKKGAPAAATTTTVRPATTTSTATEEGEEEGSLTEKLDNEEKKTHAEGKKCLQGLKDAWVAKTGKAISNTVFCLVTTHEHTNRDCIGELPNCKFVTVDGCSFMKFDKERSDTNKEVSHAVAKMHQPNHGPAE